MRLPWKRPDEDHAGVKERLDEHERKLAVHEQRLARLEHLRRERRLFGPGRERGVSE